MKRRRKYVLTIRVETYDQNAAAEIRAGAKRFVGRINDAAGVLLTRQEVDGVVISEPVVLMVRVLET